jgi:hypothetical protein
MPAAAQNAAYFDALGRPFGKHSRRPPPEPGAEARATMHLDHFAEISTSLLMVFQLRVVARRSKAFSRAVFESFVRP